MIATTQAQPDVKRVAPIVMGRKDYLSVLLRLIGMDLYKVRRRLLSKMLLLVGTLVIAFIFLGIGIVAWHFASLPVTSFVPQSCNGVQFNGCIDHPATLADMQHEKQRILDGAAQLLDMPGLWNLEGQFVIQLFVVLGIILAGALVGGEYSLGTVRLLFTRGPGRMQFLIAKIAVLAIYVVPSFLFLMLLGTVIGTVMAQLAGIGTGLSYFTPDRVGHLVIFLLLGMLSWFAYMLMALFFGTLGRSTVVGIVGPVVWIAIEPVLSSLIAALTSFFSGSLSDFLKAIPDYFPGNNLSSLLHNQSHALSFSDPGAYTDGHSLLVVAGYLVVFVAVASWLTVRRDVTQ